MDDLGVPFIFGNTHLETANHKVQNVRRIPGTWGPLLSKKNLEVGTFHHFKNGEFLLLDDDKTLLKQWWNSEFPTDF